MAHYKQVARGYTILGLHLALLHTLWLSYARLLR